MQVYTIDSFNNQTKSFDIHIQRDI
jgi:hypothetical protein